MTDVISPRAFFSYIRIKFVQTGNSAIRSADPENPTVEPNVKWIGRPMPEILPFEIFQMTGRSSVGPQYKYILLTLISYTPLRYVRNVVKINKMLEFHTIFARNFFPNFLDGEGGKCFPFPTRKLMITLWPVVGGATVRT